MSGEGADPPSCNPRYNDVERFEVVRTVRLKAVEGTDKAKCMGSLPRLELADLPPELASALEPRVKRLGYLGEFFKCAAHQPDALYAFMEFTEATKAGLSNRLVEVVALTVAGWMGNAYERNQHERLSVRSGFGREWVQAVNSLKPEMSGPLTSEERQIQQLVLAVLETKGKGAEALFEETTQMLGAPGAVAVLMVLGRYVVHGLFVNTLALAPPVPSIFEDGFKA